MLPNLTAKEKRLFFRDIANGVRDFFSDAAYEWFITVSWPYGITFKEAAKELDEYFSNLERGLFYDKKARSHFHMAVKGILIKGTNAVHCHLVALGTRKASSKESLLNPPPKPYMDSETPEVPADLDAMIEAENAWPWHEGLTFVDSAEKGYVELKRDRNIHIEQIDAMEPYTQKLASYMTDPARNARYDDPDASEFYFFNEYGLRQAQNRFKRALDSQPSKK